jgi:hypothetical protein
MVVTDLVASVSISHSVMVPMDPAMPHVGPVEPPGAASVGTVLGWAKWVSLTICVLGLMAAGALMAVGSHRGEGGAHLGRIGLALTGVVIISAASTLVTALA